MIYTYLQLQNYRPSEQSYKDRKKKMGKMAVADFCCQRGTFDSAKNSKKMKNKYKKTSLCIKLNRLSA